jgi:hypothetical protein
MRIFICRVLILAVLAGGGLPLISSAQYLDLIGVTALRAATTNLNGAGIHVAQAEANNGDNGSTNSWEVNPANVYQPVALFTYTSGLGASSTYPNPVGDWSSHADAVGNAFYGRSYGVATNVAQVANYDAEYYFNTIVDTGTPLGIPAPVVNQSFIFGYVPTTVPVATQKLIDSSYDDYAVQNNTLFVSGAGNGGPTAGSVAPPSTCYNGISVAAFASAASSVGPTQDNGRAKPDITTYGLAGLTSFSTPYVSGAAALLMQAALRGDGGSDTNAAADIRLVKALLCNGAVKPAAWTNATSSPWDARYGAGVLNVLNAYEQLAGGKHGSVLSNTVSLNAVHPPLGATGAVSSLVGWNFATNTSGKSGQQYDSIHHYYFNVSNANPAVKLTATATLVWNRQVNKTAINNLDLFLYDCANSNLVLCSTSLVDNVEHLYITNLAQGRYDLQVWKAGGSSIVSASEPYALAWQFMPPPVLAVLRAGSNAVLTWPLYPWGFRVETRTNLLSGSWVTNGLGAVVITNGQNSLPLNTTNAVQFFRLWQTGF